MRGVRYTHKCWLLVFLVLLILEFYLNAVYYKAVHFEFDRKAYDPNITTTEEMVYGDHGRIKKDGDKFQSFSPFCYNISVDATNVPGNKTNEDQIIVYYKYPLINSTYATMDYEKQFNTSYYWFSHMKPFFKNIGDEERPKYAEDTPICQVNESTLGPIKVNKTKRNIERVEQENPHVKLGYYAPAHCRAKHRIAIIVPYRDRRTNLIIFLHYIHPLLKKQCLDYRIFVIEQYGKEMFNKGALYNIAFLETQRFGTWHCLIFHDVDLIPEDERISYSCLDNPTHISSAVDCWNYVVPYKEIFGGVTALTPAQYESFNGYSNCYWNWGGEDDDVYRRMLSKNITISRYNSSIARYTTLPHPRSEYGIARQLFLLLSKLRFLKEGLITTRYKLIKITKEKLYTHIQADVNPYKMKLTTKSLMASIIKLYGDSIEYDRQKLQLKSISLNDIVQQLRRENRDSERTT